VIEWVVVHVHISRVFSLSANPFFHHDANKQLCGSQIGVIGAIRFLTQCNLMYRVNFCATISPRN
jgi:hypothetical protein